MAGWIDRAALWLFASAAALFLILVITDGNVVLSIIAAFAIVTAIRYLAGKLPDKRWIFRSERMRRAKTLIRKWTLMETTAAFDEIRHTLPELLTEEEWKNVQLIQMLPESGSMSANRLLDIWREIRSEEQVAVIVTCSADDAAHFLTNDLSAPKIHLIDGNTLMRKLMRKAHLLPKADRKNERHASISDRIARLTENIRPIQTGVYAAASLLIYLVTDLRLYLIASILLFGLDVCHFVRKRRVY